MHLLLTDILLPREASRELLRDLALPGLRALLRDARAIEREAPIEAPQHTRPVTRKLAHLFGFEADAHHAPVAAALLAARDGHPPQARWWVADPVHFALARDHVILGDHAPALTSEEASALAAAARETIEADGGVLDARAPGRWFISHPAFDDLVAGEPLRALGRNVDGWMPEGRGAGTWRRWLTEIQMVWHNHPVNTAREARGNAPVNALWLWGGGAARAIARATAAEARIREAAPDAGAAPLVRGFAALADSERSCVEPFDRSANTALPMLVEALAQAAAHQDWAAWRATLEQLDREIFAPLASRKSPLRITLCGDSTWRTFEAGTAVRWKLRARTFWARTSLEDALAP